MNFKNIEKAMSQGDTQNRGDIIILPYECYVWHCSELQKEKKANQQPSIRKLICIAYLNQPFLLKNKNIQTAIVAIMPNKVK